jgi:hypothetical protein
MNKKEAFKIAYGALAVAAESALAWDAESRLHVDADGVPYPSDDGAEIRNAAREIIAHMKERAGGENTGDD